MLWFTYELNFQRRKKVIFQDVQISHRKNQNYDLGQDWLQEKHFVAIFCY